MRIVDLLHQICLTNSKSIAVLQGRQSFTYEQLQRHVMKLSHYLAGNRCIAGVKIGLFLGNCLEYLVAFFAVSDANGTIVPLSRDLTLFELQSKVKSAAISVIISDTTGCAELEKAGFKNTLISISVTGELEIDLVAGSKAAVNIDNDNADVALMISTSGCTGQPKHVMLTDDQLISNMRSYQKVMSFQQKQMVYCALPFCHIYSISAQILTHISLGDVLLIPGQPFFVKDFFKTVQEHRVSISAFVPYYAILMAQFLQWQAYDLRSLQYILLAGGKTSNKILYTLRESYPSVKFINTYGLTEASPRVSIAGPEPSDYPIESVGSPMPGIAVKILDDCDHPVPPGHIGQIAVKGSGVMKGYYAQVSLTNEVLLADGWLKTGDIGKLDAAGNLYIEGRHKDVIISGGRNIYPYEIEECLLKHPLIVEAAVVSKTHIKLQEVPYAFIVSKENADIEYSDFVTHCRQYLSSYKIPQGFEILEALPKISASKVNRRQLANALAREPL